MLPYLSGGHLSALPYSPVVGIANSCFTDESKRVSKFLKYLFIWLHQVLIVACGIFSCSL